ncbi:MAG TPA: GNAT family N-acetyltransferase [Polyangiaceae bacterium]
MNTQHEGYTLSDELERIDFAKVTDWLAGSYWSPGIGRVEVERGARHSSLVIGAYAASDGQVGYARVASDRTRFGFVMDVFVEPRHRGKGLGRAMVRFAIEHPEHVPVYRWLLATEDAHGVYAKLGFGPLTHPDRMLMLAKEPIAPRTPKR